MELFSSDCCFSARVLDADAITAFQIKKKEKQRQLDVVQIHVCVRKFAEYSSHMLVKHWVMCSLHMTEGTHAKTKAFRKRTVHVQISLESLYFLLRLYEPISINLLINEMV